LTPAGDTLAFGHLVRSARDIQSRGIQPAEAGGETASARSRSQCSPPTGEWRCRTSSVDVGQVLVSPERRELIRLMNHRRRACMLAQRPEKGCVTAQYRSSRIIDGQSAGELHWGTPDFRLKSPTDSGNSSIPSPGRPISRRPGCLDIAGATAQIRPAIPFQWRPQWSKIGR
jgi:hypothetical protein